MPSPSDRSPVAKLAGLLLLLLLAAAALGGCAFGSADREVGPGEPRGTATANRGEAARPNVVILFADDLGYGDLGCHGHPTIRTPRLDAMAAEGVRFTSFYAASSACTPSRVGLLTGRHAVRAGLPGVVMPDDDAGLARSEVTLAELLRDAGYRTACVGKWHLGHQRPEHLPLAHGFDSYFGIPYSNDMLPPWVATARPLALYEDDEPIEHPVDQDRLTERYTRRAARFIEEAAADGEAFFLYLAYSMPHVPLHVASDRRGTSRAGLYGDVIEAIDASVGTVLDTLDAAGVAENTLVIFTSDNGPWRRMPDRMFAEGIVRPWHAGSTGPLRGSKASTYEGGHRVPGIFRWSGTIASGVVEAEPASALDVLPTVAALTGTAPPADRTLDGDDIRALLGLGLGPALESEAALAAGSGERGGVGGRAGDLEGGNRFAARPFFYVRGTQVEAVRAGRWKLRRSNHLREGPAGLPIVTELYDLDLDPSETWNRAGDAPDVAARLRSLLDAFATNVPGAELARP